MPIYSFPEPRYIWGAGCSQSIDMDMGVASEHVWPHMLACYSHIHINGLGTARAPNIAWFGE